MIFERAKIASNTLKNIDTKTKNLALQKIADALRKNIDKILQANAIDIQVAKDNGVTNMLTLTQTQLTVYGMVSLATLQMMTVYNVQKKLISHITIWKTVR